MLKPAAIGYFRLIRSVLLRFSKSPMPPLTLDVDGMCEEGNY